MIVFLASAKKVHSSLPLSIGSFAFFEVLHGEAFLQLRLKLRREWNLEIVLVLTKATNFSAGTKVTCISSHSRGTSKG